MIHYHP
jgi:hypothetical protein